MRSPGNDRRPVLGGGLGRCCIRFARTTVACYERFQLAVMPVLTDRPPLTLANPRGLSAQTGWSPRVWVAARLSTAALVVTAALDLWRYQAWARVRGPAPARAVDILQR